MLQSAITTVWEEMALGATVLRILPKVETPDASPWGFLSLDVHHETGVSLTIVTSRYKTVPCRGLINSRH